MNIIDKKLNFNGLSKRNTTKRIILHNSGTLARQTVETIHNYHKNILRYAGIGYHYYVRQDGSIYQGRPDNTVGAHAYGLNSDSIGICFEGNFDKEVMGDLQRQAGQELVAHIKNKYNITKIQAHRDVNQTSCPGKNFPFSEIVNYKHIEEKEENGAFLVKLTTVLNIRKEPSTKQSTVGVIKDHGTYTIVETCEEDNRLWGKLKSGAGWICLKENGKDYVKRV